MNKKDLLNALLTVIMQVTTKEVFNTVVDKIIDVIEDWAEGDPATEDDDKTMIQAICAKTRVLIDVPDQED